jgi:DNA invertase Pin-like site-specific DNA recombinase
VLLVNAFHGRLERRLIGQRTREVRAVKKLSGVRFGRPGAVPKQVMRRIERQRARGDSLRAILERLNRDGVPTAQGDAQWYAATVRGILVRAA